MDQIQVAGFGERLARWRMAADVLLIHRKLIWQPSSEFVSEALAKPIRMEQILERPDKNSVGEAG